jgi:hypothetical protein
MLGNNDIILAVEIFRVFDMESGNIGEYEDTTRIECENNSGFLDKWDFERIHTKTNCLTSTKESTENTLYHEALVSNSLFGNEERVGKPTA